MSKTIILPAWIFWGLAIITILLAIYSLSSKNNPFEEQVKESEIKETIKKIDSAKQDKANNQHVILNQSTETKKESKRLIDALPQVTPTWIESDTMLQDKIDYIITFKPQ